jgi:hypothetical protein
MLHDKFLGGNISSDETHSNEYAAGTASEQTFSERKQIEQTRSRVAGYQYSKIGQNFISRDSSVRSTPRHYKRPERKMTRQEVNSRPQPTFREPTVRRYDPFG